MDRFPSLALSREKEIKNRKRKAIDIAGISRSSFLDFFSQMARLDPANCPHRFLSFLSFGADNQFAGSFITAHISFLFQLEKKMYAVMKEETIGRS